MKTTFTYNEYEAVSYAINLIEDQCDTGDNEFRRNMQSTIKRLRRLSTRMRLAHETANNKEKA